MKRSNLIILILCVAAAILLANSSTQTSPMVLYGSPVPTVLPGACDKPLIHDAVLPCPRGVPGMIELRTESCGPDKRMGDWRIVADRCEKQIE